MEEETRASEDEEIRKAFAKYLQERVFFVYN
jgi:hypothetical protein